MESENVDELPWEHGLKFESLSEDEQADVVAMFETHFAEWEWRSARYLPTIDGRILMKEVGGCG